MPAYHVEKSIYINKPVNEIIEFLSDFRSWPTWSPWLIMEPECPVTYQGTQGSVGAGYHWQGDLTGEGKMRLREKTDSVLDVELEFIKPFRSLATATFHVKSSGAGSEVVWLLDAKLPFFLFFMKKSLETGLGMDYVRGLKMLKSLLETGEINSKLELVGQRRLDTIHYIGLTGEATTEQLGPLIVSDYEKINALFKEKNITASAPPITLYDDMNMETSLCKVRNIFPVAKPVEVEPPFVSGSIPADDSYVVRHTGEYQFVGNAWSFAMFAARHNKVKVAKKPAGFEWYIGDPHREAEKDLVTEIVLFAK